MVNKLATIFLVDDDKNIVLLLEKFLEYCGHKIIDCAFNGEEAIQKYKNFDMFPDLVIMDHRMPFKNGIQATKEILKRNPLSKIIFLSADFTAREEAIELGINSFIEKPFDFHKLSEIIKNTLPKKKKQSQLV